MTISFCKIWVGTFQLPEGSRFPWSTKWSQPTCIAPDSRPLWCWPCAGGQKPREASSRGSPSGWAGEGGVERTAPHGPRGELGAERAASRHQRNNPTEGFFLKEEGLLILSIFCFSRNLLIAYFLLSSTEEGEQPQTAPNTHTHTPTHHPTDLHLAKAVLSIFSRVTRSGALTMTSG